MNEVNIKDLKNLYLKDTPFVNLQTTKEYQQGTIKDDISIPLDDIGRKIHTFPHDKLICIFCATGDWSYQVVELL